MLLLWVIFYVLFLRGELFGLFSRICVLPVGLRVISLLVVKSPSQDPATVGDDLLRGPLFHVAVRRQLLPRLAGRFLFHRDILRGGNIREVLR